MALILADRVQETTTTTGTGSVTLAGAVSGYQTFSAAVGNGNTCYYVLADQSGADWEVGIGTYSSGGNTLARTTVLASSNGGALVSFPSGTKTVWVDAPASIISFLATIAGNQTANTILAGPSTGAAAQASFRALVAADLPAGTGTVTSVALSLPSILSVSGSPVTTSGTLTGTLATQSANLVWAGPSTGAAAAPTFRALVTADMPAGTGTVTSVALSLPAIFSVSGSPVTTSGTLTGTLATQSANLVWAGPTVSPAAAPTFRALVDADLPSRSGSSLPGSPVAGQLYLWTPTGRSWLMLWDGSAWKALYADGATTLFVDTANGTDNISHGTGSGANAYKTVQFAVNQLPGTLGGNGTINIASGTYNEAVVVQGKAFTGAFTLTLKGTRAADTVGSTTATSGSNPAGNGSAGYGTITKSGATYTVNAFVGLWIEITSGTGSGQIFPIHANTATVITIVGQWNTVPDSTSVYHVYGLASTISGGGGSGTAVTIAAGQLGCVVSELTLTVSTSGIGVQINGACDVLRCNLGSNSFGCFVTAGGFCNNFIANVITASAAWGLLLTANATVANVQNCRFTLAASATGGVGMSSSFIGNITGCYILSIAAANCLFVAFGSKLLVQDYTEFDGNANSSADNVSIQSFSICQQNSNVPANIVSKNSGGWGCNASAAGFGEAMQAITYSGNTSGTFTPITAPAGGTN